MAAQIFEWLFLHASLGARLAAAGSGSATVTVLGAITAPHGIAHKAAHMSNRSVLRIAVCLAPLLARGAQQPVLHILGEGREHAEEGMAQSQFRQ